MVSKLSKLLRKSRQKLTKEGEGEWEGWGRRVWEEPIRELRRP